MTRALLASAVVMDAAGWMCAAQGAYGLARVCFSAAVPFIAAWALASLFDGVGPPTSGPYGAAADLAGRRHRSLWRGSALRLRHLVRPSGKGLAHTNERRRPCGCL